MQADIKGLTGIPFLYRVVLVRLGTESQPTEAPLPSALGAGSRLRLREKVGPFNVLNPLVGKGKH